MKARIKESKNIFPCTVYMETQDYDDVYHYLDTPEYGLSWRSFDDVEQEDVENYKYIIKNTADLRKAIDDLEEDFIYGYGAKYFKLSGNYIEDLLSRGKTLVHVSNVDSKDTVFIIKVEPAQNVELALAESFEKTIKNLQREGLFENVSSFDLNFNGKGINIRLNEGTYEWGANFGHNIDDDIEDNEDIDYYTARPDKLFKSEEAAIRACEKYCDSNPSDYCEVLHYHADSGWQVSEAYDGFYN